MKIIAMLCAALQFARSIQRQISRLEFAGGDEKPIVSGLRWHANLHEYWESSCQCRPPALSSGGFEAFQVGIDFLRKGRILNMGTYQQMPLA